MSRRIELRPAGGAPVTVELETTPGGGAFTVRVGAESLSGDLMLASGGETILRCGARTHRFFAARTERELELWLDGEIYRFSLAPDDRPPHAAGDVLPPDGVVRATMPGRVVEVRVAGGETVDTGAPLVVLESMKVQLTVTAPVQAKVAEVSVEQGKMVDLGDPLVRLEAV